MPKGTPRRRNPRIAAQEADTHTGSDAVQLDAIVTEMMPFLPGAVRTLGLAAQPVKGEDGSERPGDTGAAKTAVELAMKYMTSKTSNRGAEILAGIRKLREQALATLPAESN